MRLRFGYCQAADQTVCVVGEPDSVDSVRRLELTCADDGRLVVRADDGSVDRAQYLVALHGDGDVLRYRGTWRGGLVHRRIGLAVAVQLERSGAEPTHYEVAVTVGRAVQVALVGGTHVVAADEDSVRVRMIVDIHVLRLGERRLHRVI